RGRVVDGRPVVVVGDDFTVRGGSADATIREKPLMAEMMAAEFRLPIIRIIEGSGGGGSVKTIETTGRANLPGGVGTAMGFHYTGANLAVVPVVALGLGSVAGLGAARLAASHYSVMTKSSAMFVAGPPVVARIGQDLGKQELGGHEIQTKSGAVDEAVDSEEEAFACARKFLSYLPSSVHGLPPKRGRDMTAINQTTVPWCTIIVRNSFGVAGAVHQPAGRLALRYAWLSAYWGSLPLEGGIEAAYRADIDAAPDPARKLGEIEERLNKLRD